MLQYFAVATSQQGIIGSRLLRIRAPCLSSCSYGYPVVTNNIGVQPSTYEALAKHPNIVGAKIATTDISWHSQISANPNINYTHSHPYTGLGQHAGCCDPRRFRCS
ncbi:hypothetical protein F4823DRAFT_380573 [Ustulina deusta]|nr:hypothetical protein F4823DRAFT_380573 [Ustulina deusta]